MAINKRGISDLVATVIMVVITVSAVVIIAAVLVSFARNNLDDTKINCLNSLDKIKIVPGCSCYNSSLTKVQVRFGNINLTKIYFILDDKYGTNLTEKPLTNVVTGMEKTFVFNSINSSKAQIGIILNDKRCDVSDSIELRKC